MDSLISLVLSVFKSLIFYKIGKISGEKESENNFLNDKIKELNLINDKMEKKREMINEVNKMDRDSIYNSF